MLYEILKAATAEELHAQVEKRIEADWVPQGGLAIGNELKDTGAGEMVFVSVFVQAMVLVPMI